MTTEVCGCQRQRVGGYTVRAACGRAHQLGGRVYTVWETTPAGPRQVGAAVESYLQAVSIIDRRNTP